MIELNMKKTIIFLIGILLIPTVSFGAFRTLTVPQGGTETGTIPNYGDLLVGQNNGTYEPQATSTLGIQANPAGLDTQVQYNDGGDLAGDSKFTWDKVTSKLTVNGDIGSASARVENGYFNFLRTNWLEVSQAEFDGSFKIGTSTLGTSANLLWENIGGIGSIIMDTLGGFGWSTPSTPNALTIADNGLVTITKASTTQFTSVDYFGIKFEDVYQEASTTIGNPIHIDQLNEQINHYWSAGVMHNCDLTENEDGTVDISSGFASLRSLPDSHTDLYIVEIAEQTGITLTNKSMNYIYVDYNGGSPQFNVGTSINDFNCQDKCVAYAIYRSDNDLDVLDLREQNVDSNKKLRRKEIETSGFQHVIGGTALSTSNLDLIITAGAFYYELSRTDHPALDTTGSDTFVYYYTPDSGSTWATTTPASAIDNTQYNDVTSGLVSLGASKYKVDYIYVINNEPSRFVVLHGQNQYTTFAGAEAALLPSYTPPIVSGLGSLAGRVIVQQANTDLVPESAFDQVFTPGQATNHNGLSGLQGGATDQYYHFINSRYTELKEWVDSAILGSDGVIQIPYLTATSTTATSTLPKLETTTLKVATAIEIAGEYISDFTTYVRSLFTGGNSITITNGSVAVDDDFLKNFENDETTGQLSALNFVASGGSATSTLSGGLTVDTNTLLVDYSNNTVGIGTTTPKYKLSVSGKSFFTDSIMIEDSKALEFGAGVAGKEGNAGKIGYELFTAGALDIVGAGTSGTNRKVQVFAEGGTTFTGPVTYPAAASDPCGTYPVRSFFYSTGSDELCYCNAAGVDKKVASPITACF
jgi:hypothetical protein